MTNRQSTFWSKPVVVSLAVVAIGSVGALISGPILAAMQTPSSPASGPQTVIRVDQVGYVADEKKTAFVLGSDAPMNATFTLRNAAGESVAAGELGASRGSWNSQYSSVHTIDFSSVTESGNYTLSLTGATATEVAVHIDTAAALLTPLIGANVRFFQAQRDGADVIPTIQGRQPSHLNDTTAAVYATPTFVEDDEVLAGALTPTGVIRDVEGGWFDAGDYLKFTGTTAYATADLLLATRTLGEAGSTPIPGLAEEAAHGLAWLIKMWDEEAGVLYAQVGTGVGNDAVLSDHDVWRLPEVDDSEPAAEGEPEWWIAHRPVFAANEPGQPVPPNLAGRVAAAFALAAQTVDDTADAEVWLDRAAAVYEAADRSNEAAVFSAFPHSFYPEESSNDDMEFAAAELVLAANRLGDPRADGWLAEGSQWAERYISGEHLSTLELADVSALGHADLITAGAANASLLVEDLRRQLDDGVALAGVDPFASGVEQTSFDAVPHAFGLATTAALYERVTGEHNYADFASQQRSWVFGANAWGASFMVGAGEVTPHCPEHQVANLAGQGPLEGAVVNGPNAAELLDDDGGFDEMAPCSFSGPPESPFVAFDGHGARYVDHVGAWQTVEPAIDFTSTAAYSLALSATK